MLAFRIYAMCWPLVSIALCGSAGCASKRPEPIMAPSAGLPSYAIGYPERLSAETAVLVADKQQAHDLSEKMATRPTELKPGANPELLLVIVKQADEAGRSEAFVQANAEARELRAFWEEERGPITARVNGAAQKHLTEANCGPCAQTDLGGPLSYALSNGIDKQLEKRLRACNEAQRTIELNKDGLGNGNVAPVQKLADDIALTSYQVNVALPQERNRIDSLLDEQDDIESTLTRAIEWEQAYQATNRSAADKKDSQERLAVLEKSRAAVAPAVTNAEAARKDLDPQIEQARKRYADALEALENELKAQQARAVK